MGPWVDPDTVLGQLLSFWQFPASAYQQLVLGTLLSPPLGVGWGWVGLSRAVVVLFGRCKPGNQGVSGPGQAGVGIFISEDLFCLSL